MPRNSLSVVAIHYYIYYRPERRRDRMDSWCPTAPVPPKSCFVMQLEPAATAGPNGSSKKMGVATLVFICYNSVQQVDWCCSISEWTSTYNGLQPNFIYESETPAIQS